MKFVSLLILFVCVGSVFSAVVGWQNNGRSDFPDATPPTSFDGEKGIGVRWKAKLPNWSNSSPIVVEPTDGKGAARVICLAEPLDYSPILVCMDADTGRELWRRELDAVAAMPKEQQDEARTLAKKCWAGMRAKHVLNVEGWRIYEQNKVEWDARPEWKNRGHGLTPEARRDLPTALDPLRQRAKELDCEFMGIGRSHWSPAFFSVIKGSGSDNEIRRLGKLGLMWSDWEGDGTWEGVAFPTPVSDGRRIWTLTAHNLYSCHDLDGNLIWQVRFPPANATDLGERAKERVNAGRKGWPYRWGSSLFVTAPLLADGNLVANAGLYLRCLDAATGKVRWELPMNGCNEQCVGVPTIVRVGGEVCVISVGASRRLVDGDEIVRVSDGAVVGVLPGGTAGKGSINNPITLSEDIVLNGTKEGLTGWRLVAKNGKVTPEHLWSLSIDMRVMDRCCCRAGLVYAQNCTIDGRTGVVKSKVGRGGGGYCSGGGVLAGNVQLGWDWYKGIFVFSDVTTGKKLGEGKLPTNPPDGLPLQMKREEEMGEGWKWLGAATPFAYKNCLYVRSYDFLWCLSTDTRDAATMVK